MNETPSLYRNTAPAGNFISLQLAGTKSNRAALGAAVTLEQGSDQREQEVRSGGGFISQSDLRLHFGLGKSGHAEKIVIRWPSGRTNTTSCARAAAWMPSRPTERAPHRAPRRHSSRKRGCFSRRAAQRN